MSNFSSLVETLIKSEMQGVPQHEQVLLLGATPDYLIERAGFVQHEIAIKASTISKICFDHGIKTSIIKRLPSIINNPQSLFTPANPQHRDSVVILTLEEHKNSPIIVPIRKNVRIGRRDVYNEITSTYAKEGQDPAKKWRDQGLLIWEQNQ